MRGWWMQDGVLDVRDDLPEPSVKEGNVVVDVSWAGVCATDLALFDGYMGFSGVPGHEFVGVAQAGRFAGQRVVGEINAACGVCPRCRQGDDRHCAERTVLGILNHPGAFAQRLMLPERNLLPLPDTLKDVAATLVEPMAAALQMTTQVEFSDRETLVIGDGRLGILCAHAAASAGARVTLSGEHDERTGLFPAGVDRIPKVPSTVPALDPRRQSYDIVVEATGRPDVLESAIAMVRPRGTLVLKTTAEKAHPMNLWEAVVNEITIVGSRCGRFAPAVEFLADAPFDVDAFVTDRLTLSDGRRALDRAKEKDALKVVVDCRH